MLECKHVRFDIVDVSEKVSLLVAFAKRGITFIITCTGLTKLILSTVTLEYNSLRYMCYRWVFEELCAVTFLANQAYMSLPWQ